MPALHAVTHNASAHPHAARTATARPAALVAALCVGAACLTGCSPAGNGTFEQASYTVDGSQVQAVDIDVYDRTVTVEPSPDDDLHLVYYESEKEFYDIAVEDGTLSMAAATDKEWTDYVGSTSPLPEYRTILVQVPEGGLDAFTLATANEDVALPGMFIADNVDVAVNGGSISLDRLDVGDAASLEAKNGSVTGTIAGACDDFSVTSSVKKGDSNLPEQFGSGAKALDVSVNNGDIAIEFV